PGPGTVWLGPLRLRQSTAAIGWWSERFGALVGAILGSVVGVVGGIIGALGGRGKARRLVLMLLVGMIAVGGGLVLVAAAAVSSIRSGSSRPPSWSAWRRIRFASLSAWSPAGSSRRAAASCSPNISITYSNATAMWRSTSASGRSQRVFSRIIWNAQRQLSLSVRCTMPRNSRRLVPTLNSVGEMIVSR